MRAKRYYFLIIFSLLFFSSSYCFSQINEEKAERLPREELPQVNLPTYKLKMQAGVFTGFDSNVYLDNTRKGDVFQEFIYALKFNKPLTEGINFNFRYTLDYFNYSEATDYSNLLNWFVFDINKKISNFTIGTGADISFLYYPDNKEGDFVFHKGFVYIGNDLTNKIYHQIKVYYGTKRYLYEKALFDTATTYQDKERQDKRQQYEYLISYKFSDKLNLRLRSNFYINDSNARYIDFYDYKANSGSFGFDYKFSSRSYFLFDYLYEKKNYTTRTVTNRDYRQKDRLSVVNLGFYYFINKNVVSLKYAHRDNFSNDKLSRYSENMMTCGWQAFF